MSIFRAFFFDLDTRKEITDFAGNGKTWLGTSGGRHLGNGEFDTDVCTHVDIADWANLHAIKGQRRVTAADFPGRRVAVKVWFGPKGSISGGADNVEWRKLEAE